MIMRIESGEHFWRESINHIQPTHTRLMTRKMCISSKRSEFLEYVRDVIS